MDNRCIPMYVPSAPKIHFDPDQDKVPTEDEETNECISDA